MIEYQYYHLCDGIVYYDPVVRRRHSLPINVNPVVLHDALEWPARFRNEAFRNAYKMEGWKTFYSHIRIYE